MISFHKIEPFIRVKCGTLRVNQNIFVITYLHIPLTIFSIVPLIIIYKI